MTFLETRGQLARLLATENLVVEHSTQTTTASFNTETRVLTLPVLETENENVYNMFIGHEVGHALQTPQDWALRVPKGVPFDFVNVVEDVRIEKYIQSKFPGLRKDFTLGYDALHEKDFFDIDGEDLSKMTLIDRINLHFKLGARAMIPFSDEEMVYVRACEDADTFDKVCLTAKILSDYVKANRPAKDEPETVDLSGEGESRNDEEGGGEGDSQSSNSFPDEDSDEGGDGGDNESDEGDLTSADDLTSQTQRAFDENLSDMAQKGFGYRDKYVYVKTPSSVKYITVDSVRQSFVGTGINESLFAKEDRIIGFNDFMSSIKSDVNFMVQQFEMKKSADAYARASVHKTGVLDTSRLHNYKLTDDLFLRQTITPDGKNHGVVMMIDWSGSMSDKLVGFVKQLLVLVQFCRKAQIPFDVYTFTTPPRDYDDRYKTGPAHEINTSVVQLVQVLSSSSKKIDLDQDIKNLYSQALVCGRSQYESPSSEYLALGGTPLDNALFMVPQLIKEFRSKTKAQKVSFVCMTDGESGTLMYHDAEGRQRHTYYETVMVRHGHNVYQVGEARKSTGTIAKMVETMMEDVTVTNIFMGSKSRSTTYLHWNEAWIDETKFRKTGSHVVTTEGWPLIAVVDPKIFGNAQEEIQVDEGAKKVQIRSALRKYLKSKTSSKVLLSHLVDQFS